MTNFVELRERAGLTQKQVAAELGVDQSAVSFWERGVCNPRASLLPQIAKLYGTSIDSLLVGRYEKKGKEDESDE